MSYVIDIRRELHKYPEIGYDLPKTLERVKGELNKMGLPFDEKYGESSIVATLNGEKSDFTIGMRADMDALPVAEKTKMPYKSKIKGQMHACGHDAHTAILLDTARRLAEIKEKINCRVKFIFQASEESAPSGASLMAKDGVMKDIDCIVALHCEPNHQAGTIALSSGPCNAISNGFYLEFYGRSAHAARQEMGIDAITMAVKVYNAIEFMIAKEFPAATSRVFNVGAIHGGKTNNVICSHTSMYCTLRTWDEETDAKAVKRIKEIISAVAKESGGKAKFIQSKYYPIVRNDNVVCEKMRAAAAAVIGEENIVPIKRTLGADDFSYFSNEKPGCLFRLGIKNEEKNCIYSLHQDRFNIDEDALKIGSDIFVQFVMDNMNGIKTKEED